MPRSVRAALGVRLNSGPTYPGRRVPLALRDRRLFFSFLMVATLFSMLASPAAAQDSRAPDRLVPYQTPGGLFLRLDPRLVPGLDVLRQFEIGRELVEVLAQGEMTLVVRAEPRGVWAHHDPAARVIVVDESLGRADPRTLAALLSHEAVHVRQTAAGADRPAARATAASCYAEEIEALHTELQVWQELFGPQGKAPAEHAYEREQNAALAQYLATPARYWDRLAATYARVCGQ
jgi:hypothetical protein